MVQNMEVPAHHFNDSAKILKKRLKAEVFDDWEVLIEEMG